MTHQDGKGTETRRESSEIKDQFNNAGGSVARAADPSWNVRVSDKNCSQAASNDKYKNGLSVDRDELPG